MGKSSLVKTVCHDPHIGNQEKIQLQYVFLMRVIRYSETVHAGVKTKIAIQHKKTHEKQARTELGSGVINTTRNPQQTLNQQGYKYTETNKVRGNS